MDDHQNKIRQTKINSEMVNKFSIGLSSRQVTEWPKAYQGRNQEMFFTADPNIELQILIQLKIL